MNEKLDRLTDEELMVLYEQGHEEAFTQLYQRYADRVYGYLRKRLSDPQATNDVFQASFLKLHRSKDQFNSTFTFAPWLFTVVRSVLLDWHKEQKHKTLNVEFKEETFQTVENVESIAAFPRAELAKLSEAQRLAVEMRYFGELSFDEIAARLETTPGNVRQLVSRGIKSLKSIFGKAGGLR
jgi:RNA polymerase sigma-70 factor (ECF subfamily)